MYRDAGADVLYAPGLVDGDAIRRVVAEVERPINVLALRHGPSIPELAALGVRRVSTGGGLARAAYGALLSAARELQTAGTTTYLDSAISGQALDAAFNGGEPGRTDS